jgi:hypothetical protein
MVIHPFLGIHTRFEGFAPSECNECNRKLICGAHRPKERLVILRPPQLTDSFCRHIPDPLPDRDRPALDTRRFVHNLLAARQSTGSPTD